MKLQLNACLDAHPDELAAWYRAAPPNAACMIMTLRKLTVYPTKPKNIDPETVLEGRLFWPEGELRWQRLDRFDGTHRRSHLHVVVAGAWLEDQRLPLRLQLKSGIALPGPVIWEKRKVSDQEIFSVQEHSDRPPQRIRAKLWFDDDDIGYFQWSGLEGEEVRHDG